jgi:hypothetical protein
VTAAIESFFFHDRGHPLVNNYSGGGIVVSTGKAVKSKGNHGAIMTRRNRALLLRTAADLHALPVITAD